MMTISITALKAGDVVFDAHIYRMGNTTTKRIGVWRVSIKEVDQDKETVIASWNGNPPKMFRARAGKFPWRRHPGSKASAPPP